MKKAGQRLVDHADNALWRCAEMLLTMELDLAREDYGSFLRKLTPVMYKLTEEIAISQNLPYTEWMNSYGKFDPQKVPEVLQAVLCPTGKPTFLSTENLLSILGIMNKYTPSAALLRELRDKV